MHTGIEQPVATSTIASGGMPVVASDVAGLAEVVTDGTTGLLVPPDDPEGLARAVRRVLDDDARRAQVVANGREEARRRFGAPTMVRAYQAIFDELARARR